MNEIIMYAIVFIYGIIIGSFLNVCIFRIPKETSIVFGRSHCMNCNVAIKWYDLIPVFSYIVLRGKCRNCKAKISKQYPVIEVINGLLYLIVFFFCGLTISRIIFILVIICLFLLWD
jgi:leader peptidase (prepilin peptidase)/N-methyltransferase